MDCEDPQHSASKSWPVWAKGFLVAYSETGTIRNAAAAVKKDRKTITNLRGRDEAFAAAMQDAYQDAMDKLEVEAFRRALEGTEVPVYQGGELVGTKLKYSDTLLIFLLNGGRPEKYRDRVTMRHEGDTKLGALCDAVTARLNRDAGGAGETSPAGD